VRFLRAIIRANQWVYDPANRTEAEAILAKETGADGEVASALYELYVNHVRVYRPDAEPLLSHLQGNIGLMVELGEVEAPGPNPENYLDLGPLKEAQASLATARR
jgi:ABC-type nitrate/sulfonate/bicarbonate transport system substrate-binding protein